MTSPIKGIRFVGVLTDKFAEMCHFYESILGLDPKHSEDGFRTYDLPNGDRVELFATNGKYNKHFTTGPVVGFQVDDIKASKAYLEKNGIEFIGAIQGNSTKWAHFRGPDGNIYELTNRP